MKELSAIIFLTLIFLIPCSAWSQEDDLFQQIDPKLKKELGVHKLTSKERIKLSNFIMMGMTKAIQTTASELRDNCSHTVKSYSLCITSIKSEIASLDEQANQIIESARNEKIAIMLKDPIILDIHINRTLESALSIKSSVNSITTYMTSLGF